MYYQKIVKKNQSPIDAQTVDMGLGSDYINS